MANTTKKGAAKLITIFKSSVRRGCKSVPVSQLADYSGLSEKSVYMHISWMKLGKTRKGRLQIDAHSGFTTNYLVA